MKKIIPLLLLALSHFTYAQDWPVKAFITQKQAGNVIFEKIPAFRFEANKKLAAKQSYQLLQLSESFIRRMMTEKPAALELTLPLSPNSSITLLLARYSLGNVKITENDGSMIEGITAPITYRGIVKDETNRNNVMLTVNEETLSLMVFMSDRMMQVTRASETGQYYRLYNSTKMVFPPYTLQCGTAEKYEPLSSSGIDLTGGTTPTAVGDKCINLFIDCFDSLFINQSSSRQRTISFVYELMNGVAIAFFNDTINIQITTINVWTTADPFNGMTRETQLRQLADHYRDNFWGNICVGLDFTSRRLGGLADDIGRIKATAVNTCPAYGTDVSACCYNDLADGANAQNFPVGPNTNHSQMYLVTHEIGHHLGSRHTKWCGWQLTQNPPTFGRIDSCGEAEPVNGCPQGMPPPGGGGTIMSYCFVAPSFINFNAGFGTLPGRVIRNFVESSSCVLNCSDCFGLRQHSHSSSYASQHPNTPKNGTNNTSFITGSTFNFILTQKAKP